VALIRVALMNGWNSFALKIHIYTTLEGISTLRLRKSLISELTEWRPLNLL
jgi:hypothetical protein